MPRQLNPADYGVGSFQELARIIGTLGGETVGGGAAAKAILLDIARNRSLSSDPQWSRWNTATDTNMEGGPENYTGIAAQMTHPKQFSTWSEGEKHAFKKATDLHNDIIQLSRDPSAWDSLPASRQREINDGLDAMRGVLVTRDLEGASGGAFMYSNPRAMSQRRITEHNRYGLRDSPEAYGQNYYTGNPGDTRSVRENMERFDLEGRLARMRAGSPPPPYEQAGYAALDPRLYDPATSADYIGSPQGGPGFGHVAGVFPNRPPEFTGGEYRVSPSAPAEDMFNINRSMGGFQGMRAGGGDVAGIDTAGIAFDRHGNPLGTTGISRAWQEGLRDLQGAYDNTQGVTTNSADFAGRYAYPGDIRPQDALFLRDNPGGWVTREGRQVLPIETARDVLGLGSPQDYTGRYDTAALGLDDALFLQQNPQFTLARGGANTGYGYRYDPTTGGYIPNTTGAGADQRQQGGSFTPNPAPNTGVFGNTPSPADLNGFNTPTTPWNPAPPDVSTNPAAVASTIPGITTPTITEAVVPSFGNPSYNGGLPMTPLGGSGVSPSTVGPSGVANPYGTDPNNMGGSGLGGGGSGPMIITVNPSSTFW